MPRCAPIAAVPPRWFELVKPTHSGRSLPSMAMPTHVELPRGVSPPGAPRTVREPLDSYGSRCSAVSMTECQTALPCPWAPPVAGWPVASAEQRSPFGPAPLQSLHPYYKLLRPCAPLRYSGPCGGRRLDVSLGTGATGSHVPYKSLVELRATYMPDAARAGFRVLPS